MQMLVEWMKADEHPNAGFAHSSHNLWIRFKNYKDNPPFVNFTPDYKIGAVCMITKLKREPYANLYEIFAVRPGYATDLYWEIMAHMRNNGGGTSQDVLHSEFNWMASQKWDSRMGSRSIRLNSCGHPNAFNSSRSISST